MNALGSHIKKELMIAQYIDQHYRGQTYERKPGEHIILTQMLLSCNKIGEKPLK